MRLFEFADSFVNDLQTLLRNLVGRGDSKNSPQNLSYPALSHLMKNMGNGEINYQIFSDIYDANPGIQQLVKNYNDQGIVLDTKVQYKDDQQLNAPTGGKSVDQLAHNAVSRGF